MPNQDGDAQQTVCSSICVYMLHHYIDTKKSSFFTLRLCAIKIFKSVSNSYQCYVGWWFSNVNYSRMQIISW